MNNDHIADTNKMVSDTPRMDASHYDDGVIWNTGRQLERELNAANIEVERLTNKVAQLYEGAEEQKQRIQRLEEAGNELYDGWRGNRNNMDKYLVLWAAAKESK